MRRFLFAGRPLQHRVDLLTDLATVGQVRAEGAEFAGLAVDVAESRLGDGDTLEPLVEILAHTPGPVDAHKGVLESANGIRRITRGNAHKRRILIRRISKSRPETVRR